MVVLTVHIAAGDCVAALILSSLVYAALLCGRLGFFKMNTYALPPPPPLLFLLVMALREIDGHRVHSLVTYRRVDADRFHRQYYPIPPGQLPRLCRFQARASLWRRTAFQWVRTVYKRMNGACSPFRAPCYGRFRRMSVRRFYIREGGGTAGGRFDIAQLRRLGALPPSRPRIKI